MTRGRRPVRRPPVTASAPGPLDPNRATRDRIDALVASFTELGPAWHHWTNACAPPLSVSYIRMRLLQVLRLGGEQTMTQIAQSLGITQRRVTDLVDALIDDGFVRRRRNPADGRSTVVSLTPAGRRHQESSWRQQQDDIGAVFGDLPPDLQQHLLIITPLLIAAIRRRLAGHR